MIKIFIIYIFLFLSDLRSYAELQPINLRCEYLVNPLGIDTKYPRLTWAFSGHPLGHTSIQIIMGTDSASVAKNKGNMWQSSVLTVQSLIVLYAGKELRPFTRYYWKVINKTESHTSQVPVANFETGMMEAKNWKGSWISDDGGTDVKPAPYFRREINISNPVRSARAYIAAAGLFECHINGQRVGNERLEPAYTRFDRRTLYITKDITSLLQQGGNAIGIILGNGWYNHQSTAVWNFHIAPWRQRPAFCMDIRITYADGSVETIATNKEWKTTTAGHIIFNSIYTAEHHDANKELTGWTTTSYNDSAWKAVRFRSAPSGNIVAETMHPIRFTREIKPKSIVQVNDTTSVFDMGQNISGVTRLAVKGPQGTIIKMKHGERLDSTGHVDLSNLDVHYRPTGNSDPFQTDIFILNGKGENIFTPSFNYKGFQYVEVTSSSPLRLTSENLTAFFMHSDVPAVGTFHSSNSMLNKLWQATNNSYLSNLFGYPTDCPQREKNGWTGDAHIAIETGLYNFDGITIYEKWMEDHRDEQQPNGVLPAIIPTGGWGYEWANGTDWTSTIAIIPWTIYQFYGDTTLLSRCYENIARYVNHIEQLYPSGLTDWGLGDWVPVKSKTPVEFTSSVFYYNDARILADAAKLFKRNSDYVRYNALASKIKDAINRKYLDTSSALYGTGLQTELSFALHFKIVPEQLQEKVAANLAKRVEQDNFHLDVGLLGTKTILNALSDYGYPNHAYKIASQETYPSWGWWIVNGATTLYENWNIHAASDLSMNHIMFGEIGAWLYKELGGIKADPAQPGFQNILLHPHFVDGLDSVNVIYNSVRGVIRSAWKKTSSRIEYVVEIPANTTATLTLSLPPSKQLFRNNILSGKTTLQLTSGRHEFIIQ